ncbi:acyl-CoA thioesterase [Bdellovibrio sp. HCB337]|uniref:acyl-CoA thioesterase n=1 Tax=Bdellovibrio sp. HCB337 TaxID=3394358 RepID=UPI0039A68B72
MAKEIGTYKLLIREGHLDTYGHVNNARYLDMYEEARWDLVTGRGYGFKKVHDIQQGPVILEVNLKFMKELRLREEITITTELVDYPGKIGRLKQQMIKPDGTVASEAIFVFGLFDLKARKMIEPTPEWKKAVGYEG